MHDIQVGDKVRLTGKDWDTYDEGGVFRGAIVEVTEIDIDGIWAGEAGTVGNLNGLYSDNNPEHSGDYSCELVSGNSEEAIRNRAKSLAETVTDFSSFEQNVRRILDGVGDTIVAKNLSYGDSALNPIRVFSKADRTEQLYTRLDDKLSRVQKGHEYPGDDTIRDIIGYCTLILIAREGE